MGRCVGEEQQTKEGALDGIWVAEGVLECMGGKVGRGGAATHKKGPWLSEWHVGPVGGQGGS